MSTSATDGTLATFQFVWKAEVGSVLSYKVHGPSEIRVDVEITSPPACTASGARVVTATQMGHPIAHIVSSLVEDSQICPSPPRCLCTILKVPFLPNQQTP